MIDLFNMDNIRILQQLGYEVHVASNFKFGSITSQERVDAFRKELKEAGIRVCHIPIPRSIGDIKNIVCSYRQMKRLLEKERYAIVHTQSPIGGVVTRLAAGRIRKHGGKVIYTAHGFHFFKFKVHMLKVKQNMMGVFCTCHHTMLVIVCSFSFYIRVCMQAFTRLANLCRFWVPLTNPLLSTWFMLSLRCVEVILAQKMFL